MLHLLSRKNRASGETLIPLGAAKLFTWGQGGAGILGTGSTTSTSSPAQVGSLTDWAVFSKGQSYNCFALKTNGTIWGWGINTYGAVGDNTTTDRSSPVQIGSATNWVTIGQACGAGHNGLASAVNADGKLYTWGAGQNGRLMHGNTTNYSNPTQVGSLTDWSRTWKNTNGMFAIKTDGTLWACGLNSSGQLGDGTTTVRSSPVQIGSLTDWFNCKIAAGNNSTRVIKADGTAWAWGRNSQGRLTLGDTTDRSSPTQIGSATDWAHVSTVSGTTTFLVNTSGKLYVGGRNNQGQLGNGNTTDTSSLAQLGSLTTWKTGGSSYSAQMVKTDGTLWTWGYGGSGNLGTGTTSNASSPVQVGSLTTWKDTDTTRGGVGLARVDA